MASKTADEWQLHFHPVTADRWPDLEQLFAQAGVQNGCWCMYWRIKRADFQKQYGQPNHQALKTIVASGQVPGILAYHQEQTVGWCSVAPREQFPVLDRSPTLKRVDDRPVWSIVCFYVSKPYQRRGMSNALLEAAVAHAGENGARIVEAYPLIPENSSDPDNQRYMGVFSTFREAGFEVVARRSPLRPVMRAYISNGQEA